MAKAIITVGSITYAVKCRKLLSKSGIRAKLIKVDSSKTAHGCNYGIEIDKADFYNTAMVLRSEGINYEVYKD